MVAHRQPRVSIEPHIGQTLAETATRVLPVATVADPQGSRLTGLIMGMLTVAILVFAMGAMPTRYIPSGRIAYVLGMRRLQVTLIGVPLLLIALLTIALTGR